MWKTETIPDDFKHANIVKIFKQGDQTNCGNYRRFSLLSIAGKILSRIVAFRLGSVAESILPKNQSGFGPRRRNCRHVLCSLLSPEMLWPVLGGLYGLHRSEKGIDTADRPILWKILGKAGCPSKFITMLWLLHEYINTAVLVGGELSLVFEVKAGFKEGCVLVPTLFSALLTAVLNLSERRCLMEWTYNID